MENLTNSRKIIDNVLPTEIFENLKASFNDNFPWYLSSNVTYKNDMNEFSSPYHYKFHHLCFDNFVPTSSLYDRLMPLINFINPSAIKIARIFLTTYTGKQRNQGFHTDWILQNDDDNNRYLKSSVFYINSNNGGTLFEDGQFVQSVENRLLTFATQERHAAITADDVSARIVVNMVHF
jgi:hypothetical protein